MARYLVLAFAMIGAAMCDDSGYAAPASSYGAPSNYGAPTAPAAPSDSYGFTGYEQPGYTAPAAADDGGDLFNLDKILELVPFFLAVFAAIIVAQLFAPLLGVLFDAKVGLLAPFGNAKIDLINAILTPFNLSLCSVAADGTLSVAGTGREFSSGFNLSPAVVDTVANLVFSALESK